MNFMKNGKIKRAIAAAMCASLMVGLGVNQNTEVDAKSENQSAARTDSVQKGDSGDDTGIIDTIEDTVGLSTDTDADKDETVYVVADAEGKSTSTIVDEWLKNTDKSKSIKDTSSLSDIKNVKGNESFKQDGKNITWDAEGSSIYYQGKSSVQLPVGVNVSYYIGGKKVSPSEIAGKSGKVKIRFDYQNNSKKDGVYTPFMMATGLILDGEHFKNVETTNGKVISDGDKYIVAGMGMPGLAESLDIKDKDINIPDYFEITADATNFKLDMSVTVASTDMMGISFDKDLSLDKMEDKINDLSDQYSDGMDQLVDGIKKYTDGVSEVKTGTDKLDSGAKELNDGASKVSAGIGSAGTGSKTLKSGLDSAASGASQLSSGLNTVGSKLSSFNLPSVQGANTTLTADQQSAATATIKANAEKDGASASNVTSAVTSLVASDTPDFAKLAGQDAKSVITAEAGTAGTNANSTKLANIASDQTFTYVMSQVSSQMEPGIKAAVTQQVIATVRQQQSIPATVTDDEILAYPNVASTIETTTQSQMSAQMQTLQPVIAAAFAAGYGEGYGQGYGDEYGKLATEFGKFSTDLPTTLNSQITNIASIYAAEGMKYGANLALSEVDQQLSLYTPEIQQLKAGISQLSSGANTLNSGVSQLDNGAETLAEGLNQLDNGGKTLVSGTKQLKAGTSELKDGLDKLDASSDDLNNGADDLKKATQKIIDQLDSAETDANDMTDKINKIVDAGEAYQSFGGISKDMKGSVKFVIKTDSVSASENNK